MSQASLDQELGRWIKMLNDRCEIMALLCSRSSAYWNHWKLSVQLPLIITSSSMAILNSFADDGSGMQIPNVIVNSVSVLLMTMNNSLKIFEKVESFRSQSQAFIELSHEIEALGDELSSIEVNALVSKYDMINKSVSWESIPSWIKSRVRNDFGGKKHLPLNINGVPVLEEGRIV